MRALTGSIGAGWLAVVLLGACSQPATPGVVMITVDTLRADKLGSYGYGLDTSPNIDALATRGVRFADAAVQWPKTWPSIASLLTGSYPRTTGLGIQHRRLPDSLLMLSEVFGDAGYETAAVVANFNLGKHAGFDQGFDHFVESWQERWQQEAGNVIYQNAMGRVKSYTDATLVTDQALRWLEAREPSRPFFLWLHYMDPHGPYVPPERFAGLFADRHPSAAIPMERFPPYQRQSRGQELITDLAFYKAQYDREIRYLDEELGRLFAAFEDLGLGDSLIVLTADHGESLGEHGYYLEHGLMPYQPTAHVPLIFAQRGRIEGGRNLTRPVGLIDIPPTVVELAGLPVPPSFEGVSLSALIRGAPSAPGPERVFTEGGYDQTATQLTVREGRWKLIHVRSLRERSVMTGAEYELYDLEVDRGESRNLVADHPEVVARLRARLEAWYGGATRRAELGDEIDLEALDDRSRDMLRALGYLQDGN